jgi:hypothetical protein
MWTRAPAPTAFFPRTGFVYREGSTVYVCPVERSDGLLGIGFIGEFNEAEST